MNPIKVLLFDDSRRIRDSLAILFSSHPEFEWRGAFADASHALEILDKHTPHVVLMDIEMPGISGIEATKAIKKKFPNQVVIMLTTFDDDDKICDAILSGASGYILKNESLSYLVSIVKQGYEGKELISSGIATKVQRHDCYEYSASNGKPRILTQRDKEALTQLAYGKSDSTTEDIA